MKAILQFSLFANMALLGALIFFLTSHHEPAANPLPALSKVTSAAQAAKSSPSQDLEAQIQPFRWSQLEPSKNYEAYIANLRAIGCPEPTIEDIVRGDTERTFSWERNQLGLDGSGNGPWSQAHEAQLVAGLLGYQPTGGNGIWAQDKNTQSDARNGSGVVAMSETGGSTPVAYLSSRRSMEWTRVSPANARSIVAPAQQQSLNDAGSASIPNNSAGSGPVANAETSNDPFPSAQERMRQELLQYYRWYQPQVIAATASGEPLVINPATVSGK